MRSCDLQSLNERFEVGFSAFEVNFNAFFSIQDPARERVRTSEPEDKRAKANALNDTANLDRTSAHSRLVSVDDDRDRASRFEHFALVNQNGNGALAAC